MNSLLIHIYAVFMLFNSVFKRNSLSRQDSHRLSTEYARRRALILAPPGGYCLNYTLIVSEYTLAQSTAWCLVTVSGGI